MSPTVDVFEVDLGTVGAAGVGLDDVLPLGEREAPLASRVVRAVTRRVLGARLGLAPAAVPITRVCERCGHPTHGRPRLADPSGPAFSASHSGPVAVVAVAHDADPVGLDVEVIRPRADLDALAARVLDPDALVVWRGGPAADALERFLVEWTAKEAYLKATGVGIVTDLRGVPSRPNGWSVGAIEGPPGCIVAFARRGAPVGFRRHPAGTVVS